MGTGINMYGIYHSNNYTKELEEQVFLEQIEKKRRRKRYDFSNILGEIPAGNRPWEF